MKLFFHQVSFILLPLVWAGMILGISFLEAPVKFTAPSLTFEVGLDMGRHVFGVFNKIEMILGLLLLALLITEKNSLRFVLICLVPLVLLGLQSFWLLPVLDERVLIIINGGIPQGHSPHQWYVIIELVKLIFLLTIGLLGIFRLIKPAGKPA